MSPDSNEIKTNTSIVTAQNIASRLKTLCPGASHFAGQDRALIYTRKVQLCI